ncbi:hypothetical protein [Methanosalsum natronophilum]|uniref:hypothetical protein n=1 Tax=Methanosalsum natronophilum TaxID=768733 RepID=UPI002169B32C|nr:hypothetical protein [Methanosalsum natronophilum]MCS3924904.1 hypothetical protein [Methanosalsum natronophilum]
MSNITFLTPENAGSLEYLVTCVNVQESSLGLIIDDDDDNSNLSRLENIHRHWLRGPGETHLTKNVRILHYFLCNSWYKKDTHILVIKTHYVLNYLKMESHAPTLIARYILQISRVIGSSRILAKQNKTVVSFSQVYFIIQQSLLDKMGGGCN